MKTAKFLANSIGLYFFEHENFLNIGNKTSLKTAIFSLFFINFIFSLFGIIIFGIYKEWQFIKIVIDIILSSIFGFLFLLLLLIFYSVILHFIYIIFLSNARFKKVVIATISMNIIFFIVSFFLGGILYYIIVHPNLYFHGVLFTVFFAFNLLFLIWYFVVNYLTYAKVERVSKIKSLFLYGFIFFLIIVSILFFVLSKIILYLKEVY